MIAPIVQLQHVRHRASGRFTLEVPALTIGPGVTAVLGLNGCGKTTLLRVIATVIAPTDGAVTIGGSALGARQLTTVRHSLGYLPQDDSVPGGLTVFDHVDLVAVMRELDSDPRRRRAAVHRALCQVELSELSGERCDRLSGGQRRRVALAAALVGDAGLLVLDEPDGQLDRPQRDNLACLLRGRAPATTIVLATHDDTWAEAVADRIVRLADGAVVAA